MQNPNISKHVSLIHGPALSDKVKSANILIAGVGGIGVEIIKNLVLSGFTRLTLIDFDVVDISNLNRNLYLKKEHAIQRQSKVEVVAKTILEQYPSLEIQALNQSIMNFQPDFFKGFDVIFCAVDALIAREYLGTMCCIANKPMIEAGTQGFAGQVKMQIRGKFACNMCRRFRGEIEEAGCSVRAIPREPIHAVAWAKDLFGRLFNKLEEGMKSLLLMEDEERMKNMGIEIFDQLFCVNLKTSYDEELLEKYLSPITYKEALEIQEENSVREVILEAQKIWSIEKCAKNFLEGFGALVKRKKNKPDEEIEIDKDDKDIMRFLCATSNLRIYNFLKVDAKLKYISLFELREKVENMVPTISSTNSIVAGIQVAEAIKCLKEDYGSLKKMWVGQYGNDKVESVRLDPTNFKCEACSYKKVYLDLRVRPDVTLGEFKEFMERNYCVKEVTITRENRVLYDETDDDEDMKEIYEGNLKRLLNKGLLSVNGLNDPFEFHCYIELTSEEMGAKIVPGIAREKVVEQQRIYLQQVYDDEKQKMMKLYKRHIF